MNICFRIFILCHIFHFSTSDLGNFVDEPSHLGLVYIANSDELEFYLKDRPYNGSTKIEPTRTLILNNTDPHLVKTNRTEVLWDKYLVPSVNAFYAFDKSAVHVLLDFVKLTGNVQKLSQKHLQLIKRYVFEWFEVFQEPEDEYAMKMNEELGIQSNHIPKAMEFHDIVIRNILRVQIDLQRIMDYSNDNGWREQVADKITESEALFGIDIFREGEIESVSNSLARLSRTYNLHPFELFSQNFKKDSSFLSIIHASLQVFFKQHMTIALEWFEAAKSLLEGEVSEVWKDILSQNENFPKYLQTDENYWLKLKTKRENFEREREDFAKQETKRLERIFSREENSGDKIDSEDSKTRNAKNKSDYIYLEILSNASALIHDEFFLGTEIMKPYGSFYKSLKEESVYSQTSKVAKETYITNFPKINDDLSFLIKQDKLCRGIDTKSTKEMSRYSCRMDSRNSPYLLLMPVKVEELSKDPEVMIFHHIIGDEKIHEFQQMALPISDTSKTGSANDTAEDRDSVMFRRSYVAWLHELLSQKIHSLNHFVSHLTGFIATNEHGGSELLQVNTYLSGGFYTPHQDSYDVFKYFFDKENKMVDEDVYHDLHENGDRIATFMIYMNDDMIGGRTIFPHLGVSVAPEKGSAIFWTNLHLNGSSHEHALHAGCQVLAGTKWVANKWINSNPQMYRKPCALERNK